MSNTSNLGALLFGAAVGVTLGVLYAPDKGSNTRKNIIGKKDELKEEAESKMEEGKDYVKNKYQEAKDKISDLTSKAKEKTDGVTNREDGQYFSKQPGYKPSV